MNPRAGLNESVTFLDAWRKQTIVRRNVQDHHSLLEESDGRPSSKKFVPRRTKQQRRDLAELDLDETANLQDIKMRYKQLVKRFHPDANGGDKRAEERFKSINEAYRSLISSDLPQG